MDVETLSRINAATKTVAGEAVQFRYRRDSYYEIEKYLKSRSYVGFYGLRGVGKTTILKMLTAKASD